MRQVRLTTRLTADATLPVALTQRGDDPAWEERARGLGDYELARVVAAQPPRDAEYVRFHPTGFMRYEADLAGAPGEPSAPDLTRLGVTPAELEAEDPAVSRSLWVLSYFADADGRQLVSRNYLYLRGDWALVRPNADFPRWTSALALGPRQPALEHGVLYAPAETTACWLELRLAAARGGRQRVFTTDPAGRVPGLVPLVLDPATQRYGPAAGDGTYHVYELVPLRARNALAPALHDEPGPLTTRYQTESGGGFLPLEKMPGAGPTAPDVRA